MTRRPLVSFTLRCALLFGFWLLLLEPEKSAAGAADLDWAIDWVVGIGAAVLATLLSLRLLPPHPAHSPCCAFCGAFPSSPWAQVSTSRAAPSIRACRYGPVC